MEEKNAAELEENELTPEVIVENLKDVRGKIERA